MPPKKIIADDDEVIVKKVTKKTIIADDDEVVVKKPTKKSAVIADDEAAPAKKGTSSASHVDPNAAAAAPTATRRVAAGEGVQLNTTAVTSSATDAWVAPDYDNMTFDQFKKLLDAIPLSISAAQKSAHDSKLANSEAESSKNQVEAFLDGTAGGFQYNTMLARATENMRACGIGENTRSIEIPPPIMEKIGSKRIVISNFAAICAAINRSVTDVQKYFERQTTASTSLDGNEALILKMKLDSKGVERIFDKYLAEWITCTVCKSIDTTTEKEKNANRLFVIRCNRCKAFRHVEMTESAYAANTTKRSKLRNAGML